MNGSVCTPEHAHDRGPVIKVDHDRAGPARADDVGLGVVADERNHLVTVLLGARVGRPLVRYWTTSFPFMNGWIVQW
jgi:hypothetical protein